MWKERGRRDYSVDGGRGGVKLEESGPASSWFFSLHSFSMVKLKSNNSITSGLTTCGGCPGEPETVGTSYPFIYLMDLVAVANVVFV